MLMRMRLTFLSAALVLGPVALSAQDCPPVTDHSERVGEIIALLQGPDGEVMAPSLSAELWQLWTDAPDAKAQQLLDEGMSRRSRYDFLGARDVFDDLVAYCPDYAEGYNQRAFANFLRQDYGAALVDLDRALELNPRHIAALSGKGLTLMGMGRVEEAQKALRAAVALNPWLSERSLIEEPPGTDI